VSAVRDDHAVTRRDGAAKVGRDDGKGAVLEVRSELLGEGAHLAEELVLVAAGSGDRRKSRAGY
jgi:hypothetical protein